MIVCAHNAAALEIELELGRAQRVESRVQRAAGSRAAGKRAAGKRAAERGVGEERRRSAAAGSCCDLWIEQ